MQNSSLVVYRKVWHTEILVWYTVSYRIDPVARCNRLPKMACLRSTAINIVLTTNMNMTDPKRHSATAPAVGIDGIGPTCQERREVHTLVVALGHAFININIMFVRTYKCK